MPLGDPVIGQSFVGAIVAVPVAKTWSHARHLGIGMDITQDDQHLYHIAGGESAAKVTLFPEVSGSLQHAIEAHRCIPVEPVHDAGQVFRLVWFQKIVHVIAHDAESVKLKPVFILGSLDGEQQHIAARLATEVKAAIVATGRDVTKLDEAEERWCELQADLESPSV